MKLHDKQSLDPARCADPVWELIPWYVNGSLPDDQAMIVAAHGKTCPACATEIGRQRALAQKVATADPFDAPLARSWDSLRTQIQADAQARTPQPASRRWFAGLRGGGIALFGTIAMACVVIMAQVSQPADDGFVTLTSGSDDARLIKFQPAPGLDADSLATALATLDVTIVSGPSSAGVYTASVAEDADTLAIADALMAMPEVIFAAPDSE